jgi:hypothetical protein
VRDEHARLGNPLRERVIGPVVKIVAVENDGWVAIDTGS